MSTQISGKNAVDHEQQHQFVLLSSSTTTTTRSAGPSTSGDKINGTILSKEEDRTFGYDNCLDLDIERTARCFEKNDMAEENTTNAGRINSNGPFSPRQKECQDAETLVDELCSFHSSFNAEDAIDQHTTYIQTTQSINDTQHLSLLAFTFDLSSSSSEDHRSRSAINPIGDISLQQEESSFSEEDKYFKCDGPDDRLKFEDDNSSSQKHSDYLGAPQVDLGTTEELPILDQQDMSRKTSRIARSKSDDLIQFSSTSSSDEPDFDSSDVSHVTLTKPVLTASETICKNPFESSSCSSHHSTGSILNMSAYDWTAYSNTRYSEVVSGDSMEKISSMTEGADDHLKNDVNACFLSDYSATYSSTTNERKFPPGYIDHITHDCAGARKEKQKQCDELTSVLLMEKLPYIQPEPQLKTSMDTKEEIIALDCKNNGHHEFHLYRGQECCNLISVLADSSNGDEDHRESASVKNDCIGELLMMTEQEMSRDLCFHVNVLDDIVHSPHSTTGDDFSSGDEITKKISADIIIFSDEDVYSTRRGDNNQIKNNTRLPSDSSLLEKRSWEANSADEYNGLPVILDEKNTSELTTTVNDVDMLEGGLSKNCNDLPRNVGAGAGDPLSLEDVNLPDVPTLSNHDQQHVKISLTSKPIDDNNEVLHLTPRHYPLLTTIPGDADHRGASCCYFTIGLPPVDSWIKEQEDEDQKVSTRTSLENKVMEKERTSMPLIHHQGHRGAFEEGDTLRDDPKQEEAKTNQEEEDDCKKKLNACKKCHDEHSEGIANRRKFSSEQQEVDDSSLHTSQADRSRGLRFLTTKDQNDEVNVQYCAATTSASSSNDDLDNAQKGARFSSYCQFNEEKKLEGLDQHNDESSNGATSKKEIPYHHDSSYPSTSSNSVPTNKKTTYFEPPLIAEQRMKGKSLSAEQVHPSEETAPSKNCSHPTSRSKSQACTDLLDEDNLYFNENKKTNLRDKNNACRRLLPSIQPESSSRSSMKLSFTHRSSSTNSNNNHDGENEPIVLLLEDEEERRDDSLKEIRQGGGLSVSSKGQSTSGAMSSFDNKKSSSIYSRSAQRNNSSMLLLARRSPSISTGNSDTPSIYSRPALQRSNNGILLAGRRPSSISSTRNSDGGVSGVPPQLADMVHSVQSKLHRLAIKKRNIERKRKILKLKQRLQQEDGEEMSIAAEGLVQVPMKTIRMMGISNDNMNFLGRDHHGRDGAPIMSSQEREEFQLDHRNLFHRSSSDAVSLLDGGFPCYYTSYGDLSTKSSTCRRISYYRGNSNQNSSTTTMPLPITGIPSAPTNLSSSLSAKVSAGSTTRPFRASSRYATPERQAQRRCTKIHLRNLERQLGHSYRRSSSDIQNKIQD